MQQVAPSTPLRIVYLIQDHTDSNTYYVRAVVRNSVTGTALATVDLTDTGDRRFLGTYNTPSTEDFYIDITTTVYSDSGYTTKASDKYEILDQYFIKTPWSMSLGGFGGGDTIIKKGSEVDYKKIREIIKEEIEEKIKEPDNSKIISKLDDIKNCFKEPKEYDDIIIRTKLDKLSFYLKELLAKEIKFPEAEKFNYNLITDSLIKVLEDKEIVKKDDYNIMLDRIKDSESLLKGMLETARSNDKLNKIKDLLGKDIESPKNEKTDSSKPDIDVYSDRIKKLTR